MNHPLLTRIPRSLFEQASIKCLSEHVSLALVVRELLTLWVEGRIPFRPGYLQSRSVVGRKPEKTKKEVES